MAVTMPRGEYLRSLIVFLFCLSRPTNMDDVQGIKYHKPPKMKPLMATKLDNGTSH